MDNMIGRKWSCEELYKSVISENTRVSFCDHSLPHLEKLRDQREPRAVLQLSWNQILLAQYDKKVCFAYAQDGKHMETQSKILLMDFYSTALYNIFILNKNWVHSFDLSQLPLKIAVLSDTSLFLPFLYMCSTNTPICTIFCFNGVPIRRIFQKVLSAERKWTCISIHAGYKPLCSLVLASQFFFFPL